MIKLVETAINESKYLIFFPIVDPFLELSLPHIKNLHLLYHTPPQTKPKNNFFVSIKSKAKSESVLTDPQVQNYIKTTSQKLNKIPAIMPFKPSAKIDLICHKNNYLLIGNSRPLNLKFEDKINFAAICTKHKINTIPFFIDKLNQKNISKAQSIFKTDQIVVQVKTGWAGNSTYLSDLALKTLPFDSLVKFMPFIKGTTYIQNGCIYKQNLIPSPVGIQLNNPKHSNNIFATTGRSWPSHLNQSGSVYLSECNPRLTASFNFYSQLELKNNHIPLLYLHMLEFLNLNINLPIDQLKSRFADQTLSGSQITIRDKTGKIIKSNQKC